MKPAPAEPAARPAPEVAARPAAAEPVAKPLPPPRPAANKNAGEAQTAQTLARTDPRPGRRHTPRAVEVPKAAPAPMAAEEAVPTADELTGFDDDVLESDTIVVEEMGRRG
jgi:hypothetical protein